MKRTPLLLCAMPLLLAACARLAPETVPADAAPLASTAEATVVAFDLVGDESLNLLGTENAWEGAFSSTGDGFQVYQRGVSESIPFALADDTLSVYPADALGLVGETETGRFFGVTDTVNGDTSGPVEATWTFDVAGAAAPALSVDVAAMGDFESSDVFEWRYAFDGGEERVAFANGVDEGAQATYVLDSGATFALEDPMTLDGVVLDDDFATFSTPLEGAGDTLTLRLVASTNGGSEAFAFRALTVTDGLPDGDGGGDGGGDDGGDGGSGGVVRVHEIQGAGPSTSLDGGEVVIEGVVVGDFQRGDGDAFGYDLNGFFVQEEDADADADPATSEGLFVFDGPTDADVSVGDLVRVTGRAGEYGGTTQVSASAVEVLASDAPLPGAVEIDLASFAGFEARDAALEAVEGMRVRVAGEPVIVEYYNFDRYGEIVVAEPLPGEDRLHQPTAVAEPGSAEAEARARANELRSLVLDDGRTVQNPDPARHPDGEPFTVDHRFRGGDRLADLTGVMHEAFGAYRVQPTVGATLVPANPRPDEPEGVGGSLRVASFNVLNYFLTLDARGANDAQELARQRAKILAAIEELDADVVGLIEIENDAGAATADLVAGLNEARGDDAWAYVDTGPIGTDEIKVALIYRSDAVAPVGPHAVLDADADPRFLDGKNRPALAQTFRELATGSSVTVVVNHLKSKGSACDDVGDPEDPLGQGNCNGVRTDAAEALADWLATDPTGAGAVGALIVGDLNAYDHEDPIRAIVEGADDDLGTGDDWTDLLRTHEGGLAYSYVFDGQVGYLDHALADADLTPFVTGATVWHVNADEPDLLDYDMSFKGDAQDAAYAPDAYRSSDHDPVLVGLALDADPLGLIEVLRADVASVDLNRGHRRALLARLDAVERALERGDADRARGQLALFSRLVDVLERTGRIDVDDAERLKERASKALAAL